MKVWVVTSGSYSDYGYGPIFSTQAQADEFMSLIPGDWNGADEVDVDDKDYLFPLEQIKKGLKFWRVEMFRDGEVWTATSLKPTDFNYTYHHEVRNQEIIPTGNHKGELKSFIRVMCYAKDRSHAIKIAGERRTLSILENQWRGDQ